MLNEITIGGSSTTQETLLEYALLQTFVLLFLLA